MTSGRIYQPQESALYFSTFPIPVTDHRPASHESQALWYAQLVGTPKTGSNPPTLTSASGHHMSSRAVSQASPCPYQPSSVPSHTELW